MRHPYGFVRAGSFLADNESMPNSARFRLVRRCCVPNRLIIHLFVETPCAFILSRLGARWQLAQMIVCVFRLPHGRLIQTRLGSKQSVSVPLYLKAVSIIHSLAETPCAFILSRLGAWQ